MRTILSAINTRTYKISKYITPLISNWSKNSYTINDTFSFVNEITNPKSNNCHISSFDIKSLYTNVPLIEIINIIMNLAFKYSSTLINLTDSNLRNSWKCLFWIHFIFDKQLYKKVNGLAMVNLLPLH